jgi:hypothetical protein
MKRIFVLPMFISFAMICSCQKQDAAAEQQLAQRKVELDAREDALIEREKVADHREKALYEREKALAENEKSRAIAGTIPPDAQSQDVIPDPAQDKAERDRRIQQVTAEFRAMIPDPSKMKAEKNRITQERLGQRQGVQEKSQSQQQYKLEQAQKAWMSRAAVSPEAEAATPTTSPALETSPTSSPSPR